MPRRRSTLRTTALTTLTLALLAGTVLAGAGAPAKAATRLRAGTVGGPSVSLSTPAAGAAKVVYTVCFTASSSGALTKGSGTVTLAGPAGTVFDSQQADYRFRDVTSGATGTE
jgi:hypothetical protein